MVQFYPRIDSVAPAAGSLAGGTAVVIRGGGFSMDVKDVTIKLGGSDCAVTFASIEEVHCNVRSKLATRRL